MEIPFRLIQLAKQSGVGHCSVLTSVGSNASSWFLYLKTKGALEESVKGEKFEYTSIFRPGALDKSQAINYESGTMEKLFGKFTLVWLNKASLDVALILTWGRLHDCSQNSP